MTRRTRQERHHKYPEHTKTASDSHQTRSKTVLNFQGVNQKMSIFPYYFDYEMPYWPKRFGQGFGQVAPEDLISSCPVPRYRHWWPKDQGSSIKIDEDKWQVNVDVQHFTPDEISVKTVDGFIIVEGKHEEKKDEHGFISRQFVRRFKLPEECCLDNVESRLSSDGVLTVIAPKKSDAIKGERTVPISHTGPVRKEIKEEASNGEEKK